MTSSTGPQESLERSAQDLIDAVGAISSDLDTKAVLLRIVETACRLTHARYGALGVLAANGGVSEFITHGIDARTMERIGPPPTGKGLLALTLQAPLRLDDMASHPASAGFPPHHPPMRTLLGVPIRIRGTVFGRLYLTEKTDGLPFDHDDELRVQALAKVAGIVVDNAIAFSQSERRRRWLETFSELNDMLLPPITLETAFDRIADAVLSASQANAVAMLQVPPEGPDRVQVVSMRGETTRPDQLTDDQKQQVWEVARAAVATEVPIEVPVDAERMALFVPLRAHLTLPGVILVEFERSALSDGREEHELLASFAEQAGLALDRAQALQERAEMAVVSDRDRIARDLHDVVIQRLFAAGLHMQKTRSMVGDNAILAERLDQSMRDLDQTIRDIRGTIFELQSRPQSSLRNEVRDLVKEYLPVLGFAPTVQMSGPIDSSVHPKLQQQLVAVLREALSNIARHAGATTATVELQVTSDYLRLQVLDDGKGLPPERKESGLRNAKRRAQMLGGSVELGPHQPSGTRFVWQVPFPDEPDEIG